MTTTSDVLREYADKLDAILHDGTYVPYTATGLLYHFLEDVRPLIEADVRAETAPVESAAEKAALKFAKSHPNNWVLAIKDLRDWLMTHNEDFSLLRSRNMIYAARKQLGFTDHIEEK